jgi:hypothetical protein
MTYGRFAWIKVFVNNPLDVHFLVFILKVNYCRTLSERVQGMACIFAVKSKKQNLCIILYNLFEHFQRIQLLHCCFTL